MRSFFSKGSKLNNKMTSNPWKILRLQIYFSQGYVCMPNLSLDYYRTIGWIKVSKPWIYRDFFLFWCSKKPPWCRIPRIQGWPWTTNVFSCSAKARLSSGLYQPCLPCFKREQSPMGWLKRLRMLYFLVLSRYFYYSFMINKGLKARSSSI